MARRPKLFFDPDGVMPEKEPLVVEPIVVGDLNKREVLELVGAKVAAREAEIQREFKATGRTFLGAKAATKQDPFTSPDTVAPRRGPFPFVATRNRDLRIQVLVALKRFWSRHEKARQSFRTGNRDAVFPVGTYGWRILFGVTLEEF
jgi:putative transposase